MIRVATKSFFLFILIVTFTIAFMLLINKIQEKLFLPTEYNLWIFRQPFSSLVFTFEVYLIFYLIDKKAIMELMQYEFLKRNKKIISFSFIIVNIVLFYMMITAVTVITDDRVINYSFLYPFGKEYSYNEIAKINTGIYGKKSRIPFIFPHSKGEFFYTIEFEDGVKINLTDVGGTKNDIDERFVIEKLDEEFVNMDIPKSSSMNYFEYCTELLDKIYTDKIKVILENIN